MAGHNHLFQNWVSSSLPIPILELEKFYDLIVDRQFWFEQHYNTIKTISSRRHKILYDIYFNPIILAQLSILDDKPLHRRIELIKLMEIFTTLVETLHGKRTDLLHGLPPMNPSPPIYIRPRNRLPVLLPPPTLTFRPPFTRSRSSMSSYTNRTPN